jgi:hypothetical protein
MSTISLNNWETKVTMSSIALKRMHLMQFLNIIGEIMDME